MFLTNIVQFDNCVLLFMWVYLLVALLPAYRAKDTATGVIVLLAFIVIFVAWILKVA
jgi:hypothetical protein